jgi:Flp pilus assembly protein TadG
MISRLHQALERRAASIRRGASRRGRARRVTPPGRPLRSGASGVTLVEFAIVLPIFVSTLFALIEFGVAFNAVLTINRASQAGALIAGQVGNNSLADCVILNKIESELSAPLNKNNVQQVKIFRASSTGSTILASSTYARSGSTNCGTFSVPYSATGSGYPYSQRCNILAGCPTLTPARTTVDKIGVQITYRYDGVTPLGSILGLLPGSHTSGTWTFTKQNESRMEPVL